MVTLGWSDSSHAALSSFISTILSVSLIPQNHLSAPDISNLFVISCSMESEGRLNLSLV